MPEDFLYKVGDEFDGGAVGASRFLKLVHSVGGRVEIDGTIVRIISLPPAVESKVEVDSAPVPVKEVVKESVPDEPVKEVVEEAVPDVEMIEESIPPKRRGRPPVNKETIEAEQKKEGN